MRFDCRDLRNGQRSAQRGAIAIVVGLSMVVMVGMVGLAIDGGRLYLSKTETQNAADACALAASLELTGAPNIPVTNFPIAEAAGRLVARQNRVGFQGSAIVNADVTVEFGTALSGGSWLGAGAATPASRYVRCTIRETGITPFFMQVLGFGNQTVGSIATATLAPSQAACTAIPVGICAPNPASAPWGLTPGQWLAATFDGGNSGGGGGGGNSGGGRGNSGGGGGGNNDGTGQLTGNFGWLDYSPPNGGASELNALLRGTGACTVAVGSQVGQTGSVSSLRIAWNTRFGIYAPSEASSGPTSAVPDRAGYSYYTGNWNRAVNGPALSDFLSRRSGPPANQPYGTSASAGDALTGLNVGNATVLQSTALADRGANRRIVPAPIINCGGFASSQTVPVLDWGCILMLHPMNQGSLMSVNIEYIGRASSPGSPCASVGGVGNSASSGPLVPALVQ